MLKIILLSLLLVSCSTTLLRNDKSKPGERLIIGQIKDLNPDSRVSLTYGLDQKNSILTNRQPKYDKETNFFWAWIPKETRSFHLLGVTYQLKERGGNGLTIRSECPGVPLAIAKIPTGDEPVYLGDIVIESGTMKIGHSPLGLKVDGFTVKSFYLKKNSEEAKNFLKEEGQPFERMKDALLVLQSSGKGCKN